MDLIVPFLLWSVTCSTKLSGTTRHLEVSSNKEFTSHLDGCTSELGDVGALADSSKGELSDLNKSTRFGGAESGSENRKGVT